MELDTLAPTVVAFMMVVARMSGMFLVAPILSSPMIPAKVKGMMLVVVSAAMTPVFIGEATVPATSWGMMFGLGKEVLIGLAMGYGVSLIFAAIQAGAHMIDLSVGFALANIVDPLNNTQGSVFGAFYTLVASLIFLSFNGHHMLLEALAASYQLVPIDESPNIAMLAAGVTELFGEMFANAFRIAAPVLVTLLLADVVLGLIARVVPQMNVFFVGMPMKIGVGMIAIALALPTFATFFEGRVRDIAVGLVVLGGG